jgi:hypothetical protein
MSSCGLHRLTETVVLNLVDGPAESISGATYEDAKTHLPHE